MRRDGGSSRWDSITVDDVSARALDVREKQLARVFALLNEKLCEKARGPEDDQRWSILVLPKERRELVEV
jgi:hypothetical protein